MIHDATGKFSSRWVFPDRSSLALVINRTGYIGLAWRHAPMLRAHATDREPHIGEYAAKTNAISAHQPIPPRRQKRRKQVLGDGQVVRTRLIGRGFSAPGRRQA